MVAIQTPALAAPVRRTLLDVAGISTDIPAYALYNQLDYDSTIVTSTNRDVPTDGSEKVFDKRDLKDTTDVKIFTAYLGADEPLLNGAGAYTSDLEALFEAGESLFVEAKVQELLLNPAAVDITPGGVALADAKAALGLLEQWMATRYLYRPIVAGDLLATNLIQPGVPAITETAHGTPIASAAGFTKTGPGGKIAGDREAWLYIAGQINLWKGPASVNSAPDPIHNRDLSLVEKSYAAAIDGPVAAILVGF
jgi:hypothetical protein